MNDVNDHHFAVFKVFLAWMGLTFGAVTLNQWALLATLCYTLIQSAIGLRKLFSKGSP